VPIEAVHYDFNGVAADLIGQSQVRVDDDGVWWMSNPHPSTPVNGQPNTDRHDFYFMRMTFKNDENLVTSLRPLNPSVTIVNDAGVSANVGNLRIGLNFTLSGATATTFGSAVKTASGLQLDTGPVVDGARTDTPSYLQIAGPGSFNRLGLEYFSGPITISALPGNSPREGEVGFVELDNVDIEQINAGTYHYAFKQGLVGTLLGRVKIPTLGLPATMSMTLDLTVLGRVVGTVPGLEVEYSVIPRQVAASSPSAAPSVFTSDGSVSGVAIVATNQYYRTTKLLSPVVYPGDIVLFKLRRNGTGGYLGNVGLISLSYILNAV